MIMPIVDVREVARFGYTALTKEGINGMRFPLCRKSMKFKEIAEILKQEFEPHGYNIPIKEIGYLKIKLASFIFA